MTIDLNRIPVEQTITILNPDGSELITTNNNTTFTYIRLKIKKNNISGYKVRDEYGNIYDIHHDGMVINDDGYWPDNLTGDVYDKLLGELI